MTLPPKIQEEIEKLAAIQVLNRGTDTKDAQNHLQYVYDTYFHDAVSTALTHIATIAIAEREREIKQWLLDNHEHHEGEECVDKDYPYVNSLSLEAFITQSQTKETNQ